jgi:hypothetical protein
MKMNKQEWSTALKAFAQAQRQQNPIPNRDTLSDEEEWQCRIIGGEFISWYQQHLRDIVGQRQTLMIKKFDPEPLIVFTASIPGLVAAQEIMSQPSESLVSLLYTEFDEWEKEHQVEEFIFHIQHWSYFRKIDQELLLRTQKVYPEVSPEEYRIHITGDLWAEQCGVQSEHLWRWNGEEMELLEEDFSPAIY